MSGTLAPNAYEPASPLNAVLKLPVDFGVLCLSFVLLSSLMTFVFVYTSLFLCYTAYVTLASGKWFRDMTRLGNPTP
jgi:hypothetical protein